MSNKSLTKYIVNLSPNKFIPIKRAAQMLECEQKQLNALLDTEPDVIKHRGVGLNRRVSAYDVFEWRKRKESLAVLLNKAAEPHKPIIHQLKEEIPMVTQKKKSTDTIEAGGATFYSISFIQREIERTAGTIGNWIHKSQFNIKRLPDPNGRDGFRNYLNQEAFDFVKKMAETRSQHRPNTTAARKRVEPSNEHMTVAKAAIQLNIKPHVVRQYVDNGRVLKYGTGTTLVSLEEVAAAHKKGYDKRGPKAKAKAVNGKREYNKQAFDADADLQTIGHAARLLDMTDDKVRHQVRLGALPFYGENPKQVSMTEVRAFFDAPAAAPVTVAARPIARRTAAAAEPRDASTRDAILLKALEHPDASVTNRILDLLERQ